LVIWSFGHLVIWSFGHLVIFISENALVHLGQPSKMLSVDFCLPCERRTSFF